MTTETITRQGTKNKDTITVCIADNEKKAVWVHGYNVTGIYASFRAPINAVLISATAKTKVLSIGLYQYPTISTIHAGKIVLDVPDDIADTLISNAIGYHMSDREKPTNAIFCELTTCEIVGRD